MSTTIPSRIVEPPAREYGLEASVGADAMKFRRL
jgi:hypothetical protein